MRPFRNEMHRWVLSAQKVQGCGDLDESVKALNNLGVINRPENALPGRLLFSWMSLNGRSWSFLSLEASLVRENQKQGSLYVSQEAVLKLPCLFV